MTYEISLLCGLLLALVALAAWCYRKRRQRIEHERALGEKLRQDKRDRLEWEVLVRRSQEWDAITPRTKATPAPKRPVSMRREHSAPYSSTPNPAPATDCLAPSLLWNAPAPAPAEPEPPCRAPAYQSGGGGGGDFGGGGASGSWDNSSSSSSDSSSSSSDSGSSSSCSSSD